MQKGLSGTCDAHFFQLADLLHLNGSPTQHANPCPTPNTHLLQSSPSSARSANTVLESVCRSRFGLGNWGIQP